MKINSVYPNNGGIEFSKQQSFFSTKPNSREDLFNKLILLNDSKLIQNQSIKNYEFIEEVYSSESYLNNFEKIIN